MKKALTFIGALLVFTGLKAQTQTTTVKKETAKPGTIQSGVATGTSTKVAIKGGSTKAIKGGTQMKNSAQVKIAPTQIKGIKETPVQKAQTPVQKVTTDKPIKG